MAARRKKPCPKARRESGSWWTDPNLLTKLTALVIALGGISFGGFKVGETNSYDDGYRSGKSIGYDTGWNACIGKGRENREAGFKKYLPKERPVVEDEMAPQDE